MFETAVRSGRPTRSPTRPPAERFGRSSFLRHPRFAQAREIGGVDQGADLRHPPRLEGPQASDAGVTIMASQLPGFGELGESGDINRARPPRRCLWPQGDTERAPPDY